MKNLLLVGIFLLVTLVASSQVRITSLSRSGRLSWTNSVRRPFNFPEYEIEWSHSPTGTWNVLTNVGGQTSLSLSNALASSPQSYYRVRWPNGSEWSYEGFDGAGLVVTGKFYLSAIAENDESYIEGGSYDFAYARAPVNSPHRVGRGQMEAVQGLYLHALDAIDNHFWMWGRWPPADDTWSGAWHWEGLVGSVEGTFMATRIVRGD